MPPAAVMWPRPMATRPLPPRRYLGHAARQRDAAAGSTAGKPIHDIEPWPAPTLLDIRQQRPGLKPPVRSRLRRGPLWRPFRHPTARERAQPFLKISRSTRTPMWSLAANTLRVCRGLLRALHSGMPLAESVSASRQAHDRSDSDRRPARGSVRYLPSHFGLSTAHVWSAIADKGPGIAIEHAAPSQRPSTRKLADTYMLTA